MDLKRFVPGDPTLIDLIVNYTKANGVFDKLRQECLADVDTKSSCQNLSQRIDGYTSKFLANQDWNPDLNKNELRNKLRRHIDESGILSLGAEIVVEQVFNPNLDKSFYPIISKITHEFINERSAPETTASSLISEKNTSDASDSKDKTHISDPIADILSFSYSKLSHSTATNTHVKTENVQHKHGDVAKIEVKKEDKNVPIIEKNVLDVQAEPLVTSVNEAKIQVEKDKIKKEPETHQETLKKITKDEVKSEKKKTDDVKVPVSEITTVHDKSKSSAPIPLPANVSAKKDDKNKQKSKSQSIPRPSSSSSEIKKPKKESSDKIHKSKIPKSSKDASSPTKISSSLKSVFKEEEKESSKSKSHDADNNKISSETSAKKTKSGFVKNDSSSSKHKKHHEKSDKDKVSKSTDKSDPHIHPDSSNSEKSSKSVQYSSSYDSSQGSDQEKNASTISNKERPKHFSKHANKEKSEHLDIGNEMDKKRPSSSDENSFRKYKNEKDTKFKLKDTTEAAKIKSRSNSFGSTSSVSSSSNTPKDNSTSNSDETSESSMKDKKKKQLKEKDSCQTFPTTLPPPPPPPPPSSSLTSELTSSAEMSSVEDTQSSIDDSETSSSEKMSDESSSDSELESKDLINDTLNESELNSSTDKINAFYDIFLYSSSSSEFEGYSPQKNNASENESKNAREKDLSISSVHTSDLSSFDDELSCDEEDSLLAGSMAKKLTLKEAQELMEKRASLKAQKQVESNLHVSEDSLSKKDPQKSAPLLSSDEESTPSERKRSLRRERKLNPRYSSSEYTSIFNYKKDSFITRQTNYTVKSPTSSPSTEPKLKKAEPSTENNKLVNENLKEAETVETHSDETEISKSINNKLKKESQRKDGQLNEISGSDEMDSIMDEEIASKQNNKHNLSDEDRMKDRKKLKSLSNSRVKRNSHSFKHKLEVTESTPVKRPCSRSSIDSSSSEFVPNENKPFNSENNDFHEEKKLKDNNGLKLSNLSIGAKKELFCKQKTINNGNILGQKDVLSKNLHGKVINNGEKKTSESDGSKELSSL